MFRTVLCLVICVSCQGLSFQSSLKKWSAGAIASLSLIAAPVTVFADSIPIVGAPAPDFTLPSNAGRDISLKDLAGKRTVLYFYPVRNETRRIHCNAYTYIITYTYRGILRLVAQLRPKDLNVISSNTMI
jgi:peroxiredoxin Q/BCP